MFCKYCGAISDVDALFCSKCGEKLVKSQTNVVRTEAETIKTIDVPQYINYLSEVVVLEEQCMFYQDVVHRLRAEKEKNEMQLSMEKQKVYYEKHYEKPNSNKITLDGVGGIIANFIISAICSILISALVAVILYLVLKVGMRFETTYLFLLVVCEIFFTYLIFLHFKNEDKKEKEKYERELKLWKQNEVQETNRKNDFAIQQRNNVVHYQKAIEQCEANFLIINEKMMSAIELRKKYYSLNYLYPSYHNSDAVVSILQYLQSGRCSSLEGAEGAYNIYEIEKRLDHLIDKLDVMVSKMDQLLVYVKSINLGVGAINNSLVRIGGNMEKQNQIMVAYQADMNKNQQIIAERVEKGNAMFERYAELQIIQNEQQSAFYSYQNFVTEQQRITSD